MVLDEIVKVIEERFYDEAGDFVRPCDDDDNNIYDVIQELLDKLVGADFNHVVYETVFSSVSTEVGYLSCCWTDEENLGFYSTPTYCY